jgi:hypothetical protein
MAINPFTNARRLPPSSVELGHNDFDILSPIAADIRTRAPDLMTELPEQMLAALESVLEPVQTGRTRLADLDNVEKTFVGLKVEHLIRDMLDAPKGVRDLVLAGQNVDIKNTVGKSWSWMIPPETYRDSEPCLLLALDEDRWQAWMGLIVARPEYLGKPNRDKKRRILTEAYENILWLVQGASLPRNHWEGINIARFRELRRIKGGNVRAAIFFRENLRRPTHRSVLEALLYDQADFMKRVRGNGGIRDVLRLERIAIVSGTFSNSLLKMMGLPCIGKDEHIAIDVRTLEEERMLCESGVLEQRKTYDFYPEDRFSGQP